MTAILTKMAMPARKNLFTAGGPKRQSKYDLSALTPGGEDCIVLDEVDPRKAQSKLSSAVSNHRRSGKAGVFTIRTFTQDIDGSPRTLVGVWRLADKVADVAVAPAADVTDVAVEPAGSLVDAG